MTALLRQFVYLIVDGKRFGTLDLHRINMARFFNPRSPPIVSPAMVDARLPRPVMTFYAPSSETSAGSKNFMLIGRDKVLATDQMGSAAVYDAGLHAMCAAPAFSRPMDDDGRAVSVPVGDRLYVLDASRDENFFEALVCDGGGGGAPAGIGDRLPTPPYSPTHVGASAVVGGSEIWVSTEKDGGTYSFDTAATAAGGGGGCSAWAKGGDWTLPFAGRAEYVPEYKLWFGLSSKKGSNLLCVFNLAAAARRQSAAAAPVARNVWEDLRPPKEWQPFSSYLVHLGSGRFCIARLFCDTGREPCDFDGHRQLAVLAVFTGVEVVPYSSKGLRMIKHRSECYDLGENLQEWVL